MTDKRKQRGKYVTRSVYQKVCEENKKLLHDLNVLTRDEGKNLMSVEKVATIQKWRSKFQKDRLFSKALTEVAKEYLKTHPEFDIKNKMIPPKIDSNPKAFK